MKISCLHKCLETFEFLFHSFVLKETNIRSVNHMHCCLLKKDITFQYGIVLTPKSCFLKTICLISHLVNDVLKFV